jgi:hypothetical protein
VTENSYIRGVILFSFTATGTTRRADVQHDLTAVPEDFVATQVQIFDISVLRSRLEEAEKMKGEEKLVAMERLYLAIQKTEYAYSVDFTIPYGALTEIRELLPTIKGAINRLQAAKQRKEAREHARQDQGR